MVVIPVMMIVLMVVRVVVMMPVPAMAKRPKHADREQDNEHAREKCQPRLGLLDDVPLAERERRDCENPDDNRMPDRSGDRECDRLRRRAPYCDDIRRHERLGVPRFKRMERAKDGRERQVKPSVRRAGLNDMSQIRHGLRFAFCFGFARLGYV